MRKFWIISAMAFGISSASADENALRAGSAAFTITDAILQAVNTNPGVTEAAANRRATEAEMRQTQSTLLPQVRLQASIGPEKQTRFDTLAPPEPRNGEWRRNAREGSVIVRQLLFDGLATINDVWRQAARVDAAAARVHERTELIALDAAEAYTDMVRFLRLIALAEDNVRAHTTIAGDIRRRFEGGRSGEGDNEQARERLAGTRAVLAEFRERLDEARAKYRRVVGLEPVNLRFPGRLLGLPPSKDESLAIALQHNPTLRAAGADMEAAKYGFRATAGSFVPTISLEGRATHGVDAQEIGKRDELSGKVVLSWDIFRGGQDSWRRSEMADRMIEQSQRLGRLQRDAFESLDKAWAARTITNDRIRELTVQAESGRKVIGSYTKEFDLGQRTLIDLLDARNQHFNTLVSLVSARAVVVFADYQLLAAMGHLLDYLKTAPPIEADPLLGKPWFGIVPYKLPPILIYDPSIAPKPLNVQGGAAALPYMAVPSIPLVVAGSKYPNWADTFALHPADPASTGPYGDRRASPVWLKNMLEMNGSRTD